MAKLKDGYYKQTAEAIGSDLHVLLAGGGSKALSDFATSTGVVTALGTKDNYVTWTKNGTVNNLVVPYAAVAEGISGIYSAGLPTSFSTGRVTHHYNILSGTEGLFPNADNANSILTVNRHAGNYLSQLGFSSDKRLYFRSASAADINSIAWNKIAYTSEIPTKVSQLTNDSGFVTGGPYLALSGGTIGSGNANSFPLSISSTNTYTGIVFATKTDTGWMRYLGGSSWGVTDNGWNNSYTLLHSGNCTSYTSGTSINSNTLVLHDIRNTAHAPNSDKYPEHRITGWFNSTGTPGSSWHSGFTVKGWTNDYASWQLCSYSSTGTANDYDLYFRNGNNATWGSWKTVITSGNIGSQSVNYATSAGSANTATSASSADIALKDVDGNAFKTTYLRQVVVPNNTTNDFNTFENMTLTGRVDPTTGASLVNAPWTGIGPAGGYGVLTYLFNGSGYGTQMAWGYNSNRIYIRPRYYSNGYKWATTWDSLALASDIPTKISQLTNDSGYITSSDIPSSLKNPNSISFINAAGTTVSYDGSSALDLTGGISYAVTSTRSNTVLGSYTSNGGQQNPNYFGTNRVGFLMMNTTVNGDAHYKDWIIMDCYGGNDVGGGVAFGVNRQKLGAYIMRSAAARTSWAESAELIGTHNYTTYTVGKDGTGATGSWGINVTGSSGSCTGNAATANSTAVWASSAVSTNLDTVENKHGWANSSGSATNLPTSVSAGTVVSFVNSSSKLQFFGGYKTTHGLYYRKWYNSSWEGWRTILDSSNYTAYFTDTNYYPTAFSWTGGTTAGPTGSLTGVGMSAVSFGAIPAASSTASGIVTTGNQSFSGQKTFETFVFANYITPISDTTGCGIGTDAWRYHGGYFENLYTTYIYMCPRTYSGTLYLTGLKDAPSTTSTVDSKLYASSYVKVQNSASSSAAVYAPGGFYESSDERLKNLLKPVRVDLDELSKLRKVYYTWKNSSDLGIHLGIIAQDVQKLYPELVTVDSETGYLSLSYDKLSVIALEAIDTLYKSYKELKRRVDTLEKLITNKGIL